MVAWESGTTRAFAIPYSSLRRHLLGGPSRHCVACGPAVAVRWWRAVSFPVFPLGSQEEAAMFRTHTTARPRPSEGPGQHGLERNDLLSPDRAPSPTACVRGHGPAPVPCGSASSAGPILRSLIKPGAEALHLPCGSANRGRGPCPHSYLHLGRAAGEEAPSPARCAHSAISWKETHCEHQRY